MPWRMAILVSLAIAIGYLTNSQFSTLQSAFLFSYALTYARSAGPATDNTPVHDGDSHAAAAHSCAHAAPTMPAPTTTISETAGVMTSA